MGPTRERTHASQRAGKDESAAEKPAYTQPRLIPYTVHLPGFDGPMDLLLSLIERNQLRSQLSRSSP